MFFLVGLPIGLLIWLLSGVTGQVIEAKTRANEGIRLSAKNAVIGGSVIGVFVGIVGSVIVAVFRIQGPAIGSLIGIYFGLVSALIAGLLYVVHIENRRVPLRGSHQM